MTHPIELHAPPDANLSTFGPVQQAVDTSLDTVEKLLTEEVDAAKEAEDMVGVALAVQNLQVFKAWRAHLGE